MLIFKSRIKNIEDIVTIQGIVFKNLVMLKFYIENGIVSYYKLRN